MAKEQYIERAVAEVRDWVADHDSEAQVFYSPENRVEWFDAVLTVVAPYLAHGVSGVELQCLADSIRQRYRVSLLVLRWEQQQPDERYDAHGPLVATFGPRQVQEAADSCMAEILRRLPGTRAKFVPHDPFEGFTSTIKVWGPYDPEKDEDDQRLDELHSITYEINERYGVGFITQYEFDETTDAAARAG